MKALRSIFALVFVLSVTLMSVSPAQASAVTRFTGTASLVEITGWTEWVVNGKSIKVMDVGAIYHLTVGDDRVNGTLDFTVKYILNPHNFEKGPWHGDFTISNDQGVLWEGLAISAAPDDPVKWLFNGKGVGSNEGLTLKLELTFTNHEFLAPAVSGQIIGK